MNLSKHSGDKELFSGTLVEENIKSIVIKAYILKIKLIVYMLNYYLSIEN